MDTTFQKKDFLVKEFLLFSINAGLQTRGYPVYLINRKESSDLRVDIKNFLIQYVQEFDASTEKKHYDTIELMSKLISQNHSKILINGRFRIGISQKIINLFLKYMWTAGQIKMPFHCPFDSIIKAKLLKGVTNVFLKDWTILDSLEDYDKYVVLARHKADEMNLTIAEWELVNFERRK